MNRLLLVEAAVCLIISLFVTGCVRKVTAQENLVAGTAPVATKVEPDMDANNFKVEHPERFALATAANGCGSSPQTCARCVCPKNSAPCWRRTTPWR